MLEYKDYENKIGVRFDIVAGNLVESSTGSFIVSYQYAENSIYVNKLTKTVGLIIPIGSYIGREYQLRLNDCTSLWTEWLDKHKGTNYYNIYKNMSNRDFATWMNKGMCEYFESQPFTKITDYDALQESDCLVYGYERNICSHVGIYIPDNKILHHMSRKYSSMDILDKNKLLGAYRYGI